MSTIIRTAPDGTVTLPAECCRAAGAEPGTEVVAEVQNGRIVLEPARHSLAERLGALADQLPAEVAERLPSDGAAQHDHYLYGTPKRPE